MSEKEIQLISWFEENEPRVSEAVKAAIIRWCSPTSLERIRKFDFDDSFPVIDGEEGLKQNVGLYAVNIHQLDIDGIPYVGYEFGCEWEEEHGLGVLMHGTRLVEVGFADTALHLWIAEEDAKRGG